MASRPGGAIYIGQASELRSHVEMHRAGWNPHTAKYKIKTLVWFEAHGDLQASLRRTKSLKRWRRAWKEKIITDFNPNWQDLTHAIP